MSEESPVVPDWFVERLAARDLDSRVAKRIASRLAEHDELDRLEQLAASNRALLEAHPTALVVAEIERRLARCTVDRRKLAWSLTRQGLAVGVPTLLVVLLMSLERPNAPTSPPIEQRAQETVTAKGLTPKLVIYRRVANGAERLSSKKRVREGDLLQVAYVGAGRRYGVIASIDALGAVTLHLPEEPGPAAKLMRGETPVPHAFELDGSPGFERFVFALSDEPFETTLLAEALRSGTLDVLAAGFELTEVVVEKDESAP